jgi:hypothetical protein
VDEEQIADWIAKKALQDPNVQKIVANARLFDALRRDPAWIKLYELAKKQKATFFDNITRRLWQTPSDIPSREEIEYHKGFYMGCIWVLAHPEYAEASLEKAARAAYALSQDDPSIEEES